MEPFFKYHALGNDYWVCWGVGFEPDQVAALCDRRHGLGSDGLLVGRRPKASSAPIELLIYNSDGSSAQNSGNGLRIFGAFLADQGQLSVGESIRVQVAGVLKQIQLKYAKGAHYLLEVDMGTPSDLTQTHFEPREGHPLVLHTLSLGNPHAVVLTPDPSPQMAQTLGPQIESHCPGRTNVQFACVQDPHNLKLEIWERGSGYTLASGSSAAAAVAVAQAKGLCATTVQAHMPGGTLEVRRHNNGLVLQGPVRAIAQNTVFR